MNSSTRNVAVVFSLVFGLVLSAPACRRKTPLPPPPPPNQTTPQEEPPAALAKPEVHSFSVDPQSIERGGTSRLSWRVTEATRVEISPALGAVSFEGAVEVRPTETTEYTLRAEGPGGEISRSISLVVIDPPVNPQPTFSPSAALSERLSREVQDVYFEYDKNTLDPSGIATLENGTDSLRRILQDFPDAVIVVEGHCDERGSAEYNIGLGNRRASIVKEYLERRGLPAARLRESSLGKERPQCTEPNEECWRRNRRVHFSGATE